MGKVHPIHTRGIPGIDDDQSTTALSLREARILLAIGSGGNRTRLREHLTQRYEVTEPEGSGREDWTFDLAIVDSAGFHQWHNALTDAKRREGPAFLPVILLLSRHELKQHPSTYWDLVDEFILMPIDRLEFSERLALLLRARHLALSQQSQLAYLSTHDRVTGLANKPRFMERLADTILDASVANQSVQVVVVRLNVNRIMSSFGHRGLDEAASICSCRLKALVDSGTFVARLTTETWGLIQPPGDTLDHLLELCQRLRTLTDKPIPVDSERVHVELSIGVGIYPNDASNAARTLDCAINSLASARDSTPQFYSQAIQHQALRFMRTETRLRDALEQNQFEVWYQPQIRLADQSVQQVEALVRWRLPTGRLVPPGEFMDVAVTTGLVVPIDRWVLSTACDTLRNWHEEGLGIEHVAVNVTAEDVQSPDFVDYVLQQLKRCSLPADRLELELTESTLMDVGEANLKKLNELRQRGLDIAIDDFGTGYSSLSYLHTLPINILKIDQCFIRNILSVETDAAITKTIVWLAENFHMHTIAEGIETKAQADYLAELNVDTTQGYYYGKPMPEAELRTWLKEWQAAH